MTKLRRKIALILCVALSILMIFMLTSCDTDEETSSEPEKESESEIEEKKEYVVEQAEGFEIDKTGTVVTLRKNVSNATDVIDLSRAFSVTQGATWRLYKDYLGEEEYKLKSMVLSIGENKAYLIVCHPNGEDFVRYEVVICRADIKEYTFIVDGEVYRRGETEEILSIEAPSVNPKKDGYTFAGWTINGKDAAFPYTVENDTEIVAKWEANNNTLSFNANGGSGTMSNMTISTDESKNLTSNAFTKAGYTFKGWATSANGDVVYQNGANYTMGKNSSYTLYAVWEAIPYSIEYNLNNGTNGANPSEYTVEQEIVLKNPTRAGYTFDGWYTESTFVNKVTAITKGTTGNKTFYAKWTPNNNTLVFNANGGSGSMSNMTIATDVSKNLTSNTFTRVGYTFKGWSTSADGEVEYQNGAIYKMGTNSTYTLYAVWVPIKYDITYKLNEFGKYTFENSNPATYTAEDKITLKAPTISKTYYDFVGWYSDKELKNQVTVIEKSTGDITLYAKWVINDKALTFTQGEDEYSITDCVTNIDIVIIPDTYKGLPVTTIGNNAFSGCQSLTSIVIPNSVTTIGNYAFSGCTSLTSIEIPNSVTTIGDFAFYDCTSLTSIEIPNSVTTIGDYAFSGCESLTSVTIGNSVTSIGEYAFRSCTSLTSIEIPNSVKTIGSSAFYDCTSLTSIEIPNSVTTIGSSAFEYCTSLTSIEIPNSVTTIGEDAFSRCTSLISIEVDENNTVYKSIEGSLYSKDGKTLVLYAPGKTNTSFTVPSSVTTIGFSAFEYCTALESVAIPNSVTSIGSSAFRSCKSLTSIIIPNSVTTIGNNAFSFCTSLTIYCEASSKPNGWSSEWNYSAGPVVWGYIGKTGTTDDGFAYEFVRGGVKITDYTGTATELEISAIGGLPVTTIGDRAFSYCTSLTSVEIPNSVTSIGDSAFYGCTSLTSVEIPNSVTSIGYYAFRSCTSLTIYCEAQSQPSGWNSSWNYSNRPVVWGHTHSYTNGECVCGAKQN